MDQDTAGSASAPKPESLPLAGAPEVRKSGIPRWAIALIVTVIVLVLGAGATGAYFIYRVFADSAGTLAELRPIVEADYPDYTIIDATRQGFILQHKTIPELRIDVRYFEAGAEGDWPLQPLETVNAEWQTNDTFFRHAIGRTPDPRNGKNYDIESFARTYIPLKPGPNAVVMGAWLDASDPMGFDLYTVLVARRNQGESIWPDHMTIISHDLETGDWAGEPCTPLSQGADAE
ncbi:MAG: hypothetical protein CVT59_05795 [Actinobacteria bacterium HGW-Actinobacteria-1]|nr:MAG: hypothetical protein CVT59_05795 [Actinobacteria bacterium HGW-Actinobacteria-1]